MKIALIVSALGGGGTERVVAALANGWSDTGHEVHVITLAEESKIDYAVSSNVNRIALNLRGETNSLITAISSNFRRVWTLRKCVKSIAPDVAISFITSTNISSVLACSALSVPVIVCERGSIVRDPPVGIWKFLLRPVYRAASAVVAQTKVSADHFSAILNRTVHVASNPLSPASEEPQDDRFQVIKDFAASKRTVLAVGRLTDEKGFDLLLKVFASARECCPNWVLVILGEGPQRETLITSITGLGLNGSVLMPGFSTAPRAAMRLSDIFVLSSRYEGLPNALMEAMAEGMACVGFDCPFGPAELIENDVNGLLVEAENVNAMSAALVYLMDDTAARDRLGVAAATSMHRFRPQEVCEQWLKIIQSVLKSRSK